MATLVVFEQRSSSIARSATSCAERLSVQRSEQYDWHECSEGDMREKADVASVCAIVRYKEHASSNTEPHKSSNKKQDRLSSQHRTSSQSSYRPEPSNDEDPEPATNKHISRTVLELLGYHAC